MNFQNKTKDKEIVLYCKVGIRGFNAERILKGNGFKAKNLSGGYITCPEPF